MLTQTHGTHVTHTGLETIISYMEDMRTGAANAKHSGGLEWTDGWMEVTEETLNCDVFLVACN